MAAQKLALQIWKAGVPVLKVGGGPKVVTPKPYAGTFDRVAFYGPTDKSPNPIAVIDCIPSTGDPDPNQDTYVAATIAADGTVATITLQCLIRCYIGGEMDPYLRFAATLLPSTNNAGWLRFGSSRSASRSTQAPRTTRRGSSLPIW